MKKQYESPEIILESVNSQDILTVSGGDTPWLDFGFAW